MEQTYPVDMVVEKMYINAVVKKIFIFLCQFWWLLLLCFIIVTPHSTQANNEPPVVMVFGDSLVAGHGLPQGQAFPDILRQKLADNGIVVTIINAGVSGDTTAGGLARLGWSLAANPDAAIIVLGGNDMLRGLDPEASFDNLDEIINQLHSRGVKVLLAGMQAPRNFGADYANQFDDIYSRLAARHDILLYPFFLDGVALKVDLNQQDGMHPNREGVTVIVNQILPTVKQLLLKLESRSSQTMKIED